MTILYYSDTCTLALNGEEYVLVDNVGCSVAVNAYICELTATMLFLSAVLSKGELMPILAVARLNYMLTHKLLTETMDLVEQTIPTYH